MAYFEAVQKPTYVAKAKEKVKDTLKAIDQASVRQEQNGAVKLLNQTQYYLLFADGILEDENCFEELRTVVRFLALSTKYMQGNKENILSKVKNPLRDAMMFIAVSIGGHNRDGIIKVLESAGLQMDHITSSQIWKCYHDLMKDEEGYHLKPNKRPRKGTSKKKKNSELDSELQILDPAESSSSASTPSPSHEVVELQEMD